MPIIREVEIKLNAHHLPIEISNPLRYSWRHNQVPDAALLEAAANHLVQSGRVAPPPAPAGTPGHARANPATPASSSTGDPEAARPLQYQNSAPNVDTEMKPASPDQDAATPSCRPPGDPDKGAATAPFRTMQARWPGSDAPIPGSEAPIDSRVYAPASRSSPVTPANGGTMSYQPLPAQYESAIEAIARASVNLPNKEAWRLVLEALRSRYSAVEATPLRQHVWRRRKAMQKQRKASIRQALTPARAG